MLETVIVRVSSTIVPESNLSDYLERVQQSGIPAYKAAPGLHSVWLLERYFVGYVEVMAISLWRSDTAMNGFVKDWHQIMAPENEYGEIRLEARVYKLVTSCNGQPEELDGEQSP